MDLTQLFCQHQTPSLETQKYDILKKKATTEKAYFKWEVCSKEIHPSHLDPVGNQWKWQQQNKALNPHEEEFYYKIGNPESP